MKVRSRTVPCIRAVALALACAAATSALSLARPAPARAAADPSWGPAPRAVDPIEVRGPTVLFPAGGASLPIRDYQSAYVSRSGAVCLLYDRESSSGRLFNDTGDEISSFVTAEPFAAALVSDAGLVCLYQPLEMHNSTVADARLLDLRGRQIWRGTAPLVGSDLKVEFSPDGRLLAVLARVQQFGVARDTRALLVSDSGTMWEHDIEGQWAPATIAFDPTGQRLGFGLRRWLDTGAEESAAFVWDFASDSGREIRIEDLGQVLDVGGLAFTPDGARVVVAGVGQVEAYAVSSGARLWSANLNRGRSRDLLDTAIRVEATADRIVAAHRVNAPNGLVRYSITALSPEGALIDARIIPDPQLRRADLGRFWNIDESGREFVVYCDEGPVSFEIR